VHTYAYTSPALSPSITWQSTLLSISLTPFVCVSLPTTNSRGASKAPAVAQPVSINLARTVSALFDVARANLNAAAVCNEEIDNLMKLQQADLSRLAKVKKNKGSGRLDEKCAVLQRAASAKIVMFCTQPGMHPLAIRSMHLEPVNDEEDIDTTTRRNHCAVWVITRTSTRASAGWGPEGSEGGGSEESAAAPPPLVRGNAVMAILRFDLKKPESRSFFPPSFLFPLPLMCKMFINNRKS